MVKLQAQTSWETQVKLSCLQPKMQLSEQSGSEMYLGREREKT